MKSKITRSLLIACCLSPIASNAEVYGNYVYVNDNIYNALGWINSIYGQDSIYTDPSNPDIGLSAALCTDASSRLVAGGYINGNCHVEWKNRSYLNRGHYVLLRDNTYPPIIYDWSPITDNNRTQQKSYISSYGVTKGGVDRGEFVFHCKAIKLTGFDAGTINYGKYIPGKDTCYFARYDSTFNVGDSDSNFTLSVLTGE